MNKIGHNLNGKFIIHFDSPIIGDFALCGQDIVGDNIDGDKWDEAKPTDKKVNCDNCLAIYEYVKNHKRNDSHE